MLALFSIKHRSSLSVFCWASVHGTRYFSSGGNLLKSFYVLYFIRDPGEVVIKRI